MHHHHNTTVIRTIIQALVLAVLVTALGIGQVKAQDNQFPVSGAWSEVINQDGSINYDNLTDNGVVTRTESWMPTVFGQPIQAEYHVYTTPSGNQILMPSATTLFFMASNPQTSGFLSAASTLGTSGTGGVAEGSQVYTGIAAVGLLLSGNAQVEFASLDQIGTNFFQQVLSGQTNLFSVTPNGFINFLQSLSQPSLNDSNLYTYMLLYPPDSCALSPVGCTPEQLTLLIPPTPLTPTPPPGTPTPPPPIECPEPRVIPGAITFTGEKIAPNYPLVVGQDPSKRGVDLRFSASVAPTVYISYELERVYGCVYSYGSPATNRCPANYRAQQVDWSCREVRQEFPECISSVHAAALLSQESRDWILNELSVRYPGAHLKNPNIGFPAGNSCVWNFSQTNVQIADPGTWNLSVSGVTSGTPVSAPRNFGGTVSSFQVWLKETAIVK